MAKRAPGSPARNPTPPSTSMEARAYCLALFLFLLYGLLLAYVVIRNEPIASPVFAIIIRTFTALIAGLLAAAIPGTMIIQMALPVPIGGKLIIQAAAGIGFAIVAYVFTPEVYPDSFPVKFSQPTVNPSSTPTAELAPKAGDGTDLIDQRILDQMQGWKIPFVNHQVAINGNKLAIFRSDFTRAYLPFRAKVELSDSHEWNETFEMQPGLAFVVRASDVIERQLYFDVMIDGKGKNPTNDNLLKIEGVDSGRQLLLIVPFRARHGREVEFEAHDVTKLVTVVNLDFVEN